MVTGYRGSKKYIEIELLSVKVYRNAEIGIREKRIGSSLAAKSIRLP
jgi:hypothetical protein